jgi:antitoxin component YwqK of YwqJK toxin-antitoxin module
VVVYTTGADFEKVKEELFYDTGQLDYVGHYKNGVEHGSWTYYWPNGKLKSEEYYEKGLEEGTMYDYDEAGKKIIEYRYVRGRLMKETKLN